MKSNKKLHPLVDAIEMETGQRLHSSSAQRWRLHGIAGVKLETVRVGGRRMCSVESVQRFLDDVTAATDGERHKPQARTPRRRERDINRAERELGDEGF